MVSAGIGALLMVPDGCREQAFIDAAGAANLEGRCFVTFGGLPPEKLTGKGSEFVARYRARCGLDGHPITVFRGDERLTGLCRGIAADGTLVLDTSSGRVHVTSGSLTHPADIWRGA